MFIIIIIYYFLLFICLIYFLLLRLQIHSLLDYNIIVTYMLLHLIFKHFFFFNFN